MHFITVWKNSTEGKNSTDVSLLHGHNDTVGYNCKARDYKSSDRAHKNLCSVVPYESKALGGAV